MRLRELAAGQRRETAVVLAVDGVLALAEAARGEARGSACEGHELLDGLFGGTRLELSAELLWLSLGVLGRVPVRNLTTYGAGRILGAVDLYLYTINVTGATHGPLFGSDKADNAG